MPVFTTKVDLPRETNLKDQTVIWKYYSIKLFRILRMLPPFVLFYTVSIAIKPLLKRRNFVTLQKVCKKNHWAFNLSEYKDEFGTIEVNSYGYQIMINVDNASFSAHLKRAIPATFELSKDQKREPARKLDYTLLHPHLRIFFKTIRMKESFFEQLVPKGEIPHLALSELVTFVSTYFLALDYFSLDGDVLRFKLEYGEPFDLRVPASKIEDIVAYTIRLLQCFE